MPDIRSVIQPVELTRLGGHLRACVVKIDENSFRIELEKDIQCWNEDDGGYIILQ
jgi:hypothetical protein